ncbi:MAG: tetratricopeptide repeat protein, partial [Desulfococcaceae bacterium]
EQALHSLEENLPPGHPNIPTFQSNLVIVLKDMGELVPALELAQQAYSSRKEKLGPAHPDTQNSEKLLKELQEKIEKG